MDTCWLLRKFNGDFENSESPQNRTSKNISMYSVLFHAYTIVGLFLPPICASHTGTFVTVWTMINSASAGVKICLANLAKDQHFL